MHNKEYQVVVEKLLNTDLGFIVGNRPPKKTERVFFE